jgi:hypothetical protein
MIHKPSPTAIPTFKYLQLGGSGSEMKTPAGLVRAQIKKFAMATSQHHASMEPDWLTVYLRLFRM